MSGFTVLTRNNVASRRPSNNLPLSIACPTRDLSSLEYVSQLVHQGAAYQVIPATQHPFNYNAEDILVGILPKTKNILLDISLPFYNSGNDQEEGNYYGRYLIFDQRLIGVRLCYSIRVDLSGDKSNFKRWPERKTSLWKVPAAVLKFYKANNFSESTFKRQVRVGDFILCLNNARISLFFQSELKTYQNLLEESIRTGADIVSIVNDTPRDKTMESRLNYRNYSMNSTLENQLKQFARKHKKILMYCGCRLAPLTQLYLSNSFIVHHELPEAKMQPHFLNKGGTLSLICSLEHGRNQLAAGQTPSPKGVHFETINASLLTVKKPAGKEKNLSPVGSRYYGDIPEEMTDILQKMQLWYVYNAINECKPFTIPLPLSEYTKNIVQQLMEIAKYTKMQLNQLMDFYKEDKSIPSPPQIQGTNLIIHQSLEELIKSIKADKYFVYIDNPKNHRALYLLAEEHSGIIVCPKSLMREQQIQKSKAIETIEKRINDFAQKIIDYDIYSLKRIIIENEHSPEPLTKDQLLFAVSDCLKNKIRTSFRSHPFYRYILGKNRPQIENALGEAEIRLRLQSSALRNDSSKKSNHDINTSQPKCHRSQQNETAKEFFSKLDRMKKYFGNDKKIHQLQCHRCRKYVFKNYVTDCSSCNNKTCYFCYEAIKGRPSKPQAYKECLVCKRLCFCDGCTDKKKKQARQKQRIQASTDEIINLSQTQPEKSLEELEQIRIRKELEEDACRICMIAGRTSMHIRVLCSQCDQKGCFDCIKAKQKGDRKFYNEWLCDNCKPPLLRVNPEMNVMRMIDEDEEREELTPEPNLSPISPKISSNKKDQPLNQSSNRKNSKRKSPSGSQSPPRQKRQHRSPSQSHSSQRNKKQTFKPKQSKQDISKHSGKVRSPSNLVSPLRKGKSFMDHQSPPKNKRRSRSSSGSPPSAKKETKRASPASKQPGLPSNRRRSPSSSGSIKLQQKKKVISKSRSRSRQRSNQNREHSRQQSIQRNSKPLWGKSGIKNQSFDQYENRGRGRGRGRGQQFGRGRQYDQKRPHQADVYEESKGKNRLSEPEASKGDDLQVQDVNDIDY